MARVFRFWMRFGILVGLALGLALAGALAAEAQQCPCSLPGNVPCPLYCATCVLATDCCQCDAGCGVSCPSGYTTVGTTLCPLTHDRSSLCSQCAPRQTATCATCPLGTWGSTCSPCPGGAANPCNAANGGGSCSQGTLGTGACSCNLGFLGNACQYSAATCNNHGTPNSVGLCTCSSGYAGATCGQCAASYTGYPNCGTICGDVTNDGNVDAADVAAFRFYLADPVDGAFTPAGAGKCTVVPLVPSLPPCDVLDLVVIRRSIQAPPLLPGRAPVCAAVTP
ncbi:MAG: hypothetical protein ACHQ6T_07140 [Myxococcota bacterium]